MKINIFATLFSGVLLMAACSEEKTNPKPPTYLKTNFPAHEYVRFDDACPYSFELSKLYKAQSVTENGATTCHKDIQLGPLNGVIHFSYIPITQKLGDYINFAINKVDEHKVKATAIEDTNIIRPDAKVYGTFFELQGDVASPFQFYLTDSSSRFVSGVVYFNTAPKYDSLRPSLDYLKKDLFHLMNTFEWKK